MLNTTFLIMVSGALASGLRTFIVLFIQRYLNSLFPLATFLVNILGCFIAGFCLYYSERFNWEFITKISIFSGFLAAFTTFSAFGIETLILWQKKAYLVAVTYVLSSNIAGVFCCYLGYKISKIMYS